MTTQWPIKTGYWSQRYYAVKNTVNEWYQVFEDAVEPNDLRV